MSKVRVLVTGCAGFIGSYVVERLLFRGYEVIGVDCFTPYYSVRLKQYNMKNVVKNEGFRFIRLDLAKASMNELEDILKNVDYVVHEAAQPGVRLSWGYNFNVYVEHNVLASQRLLEASLKAGGIKKFVYASSSSIYGNVENVPIRENVIPRPYSPYGVTKLAAEALCRAYYENYGLPVVMLRYFTVYGPRQRPDMAFHRFIKAMLRGKPVRIYGDGLQMRDFTYVDDVVEATILAMESEDDSIIGEAINIGSSNPIRIIDTIRIISNIINVEPRIVYEEAKKGDVRITYADIAKARRVLGWSPKVNLKEGLEEQVRWLKEVISIGLI